MGSAERVGVQRRPLARSFGPSSSRRRPHTAFFNSPFKYKSSSDSPAGAGRDAIISFQAGAGIGDRIDLTTTMPMRW